MKIVSLRRMLGLLAIGGAVAYARKRRRGRARPAVTSSPERAPGVGVTIGAGEVAASGIGGIESSTAFEGGGGFADTTGIDRSR
jgi:hypothetical protein